MSVNHVYYKRESEKKKDKIDHQIITIQIGSFPIVFPSQNT